MRNCYELIVLYDKEYGEVLGFETDVYMNDSNDIISYAIKAGILDEAYRSKVRWARSVTEYEYKYIIHKN